MRVQRRPLRALGLALAFSCLLGSGALHAQRLRFEQDRNRVRAGQDALVFVALDGSKLIEVVENPACDGLVVERLSDMTQDQQTFDGVRGLVRTRSLFLRWRVSTRDPGKFSIRGPRVKIDERESLIAAVELEVLGDTPSSLGFLELSLASPRIVREQRTRIDVDVYLPELVDPENRRRSCALQYNDRLREPPQLELPWISQEGAPNLPPGLEGDDLQVWANGLAPQTERITLAIASRGMTLFSTRATVPYALSDVVERAAPDGKVGRWYHARFSYELKGVAVGRYPLGPARLLGATVEYERQQPVVRELYSRSNAIALEVVEPPLAGRPAEWRGAIGRFALEVPPPAPAKVELGGEPVRLTLVVSGSGSLAGVSFDLEKDPAFTELFHVGEPVLFESKAPGTDVPPDHPRHPGETWRHFEYRLLPLREGTHELPPIAFAFFDPERGAYERVLAPTYRIEVAASTRAPAAKSEGSAPSTARARSSRTDSAPDVADLNRLRDERPQWFSRSVAVAAAASLWIFSAAFAARRRARALSPAEQRRRGARARAKRRLEELRGAPESGRAAEKLGAAASAIAGYFADRAHAIEEGLTGKEVLELARAEGFGDTELAPLRGFFETFEGARFAGIGAARADEAIEGLLRWIDELATREPKRERAKASAFLPLVFALSPQSPAPREERVEELDAPRLFQRALRATEEERYADAERDYRALIERGYEGGAVLFNLGNAYARDGEHDAEALACYRQAARYWPADANLRSNLDALLLKLPASAVRPGIPDGWIETAFAWRREISLGALLDVTALALAFSALAAGLRCLCGPRWALLRIAAFAGAIAVVLSVALGMRWSETRAASHAVLRNERELRRGPGASFDAAGAPLAASSELRVVERREADATTWIRVEGAGAAGWLERDAAVVY